ncbi:minichromosome maintenance domain-containing protein 2 isoform X3 [Pezoporus flaviventris]|uniref:minichromosome maintenance domain-containing protein 2 isoform X3 n=1 Tax=Pezoporus flaviventris TaxID=889875 RepID=UPI002AB17011|nr:minichromosome maintenance domain-containing protein 2 isoform X3 [Pezoporus flaviventris]
MHREIQKMREVALVYLDRSGGLQKFMQDCKKYSDSKQSYAVYRFIISINPSDIAELDATLGNYILHNPIQAAQIFQSVCFIAIKTLSIIEQLQTEAQISILLKPTHLPPLPSYVLNLAPFPFNYTSQRFYMSEGIAIAMGIVTKYTQGARFLCTEETCQFSKGFRYIRVHLPGATESATVRNDFVCGLCSSPLQEDMKFRVLGDKQIVEMIDAKVLNALKGYSNDKSHFRIQTFTVFLRDELANKMKIGNHYKIIGIPACVQNGLQATACIEINSIQLCKQSDKHGTGSASIQACSAVLAKGGICYIGDLASYKKDKLELLQSVLESRTTTVFIPGKKYGEEADQQVTISLQTNFWSYVDSSSKKHIQKDNFLIGQMDMSLIPPNLVDGFGLLIHNEFPSCQQSSPLVHHTLKKAIHPEAMLYKVSQQFRMQDYEEFILFAKNLHVELSPEAESLIQGYYLTSRRVRRDSTHGSTLSASALKILISLSKAHAKLSLRKKVLEEDALIAILFLESSLTLKHGKSALCIAPNPLFPFDLNDENSLQQRDSHLIQCHHQLLKFIGAYGPGIHVNTNEE